MNEQQTNEIGELICDFGNHNVEIGRRLERGESIYFAETFYDPHYVVSKIKEILGLSGVLEVLSDKETP